ADASQLNYEDATSHDITVRASDPSGAFNDTTFTIEVTDVAPSAPTDSDGATGGSISEGAANGDAVGITATSSDVNGGTVTFSLFDDATSHDITVRASDPSGAFNDTTFTVAVTDVAEAPTAAVAITAVADDTG